MKGKIMINHYIEIIVSLRRKECKMSFDTKSGKYIPRMFLQDLRIEEI